MNIASNWTLIRRLFTRSFTWADAIRIGAMTRGRWDSFDGPSVADASLGPQG
jgi:hypothetical protein